MGYNGKLLTQIMRAMDKPGQGRTPKNKQKRPVVSSRGQWDYPGEHTIVPTPTGKITMQGVPYPVYGQDETGYGQMMYPGGEYQFPGQMVYEQPMLPKAQFGIPSFPASVPLTSMAAKLYNKFMTPSSKAPAPTVMKTVEPQDNLTQLYDMQNEAVGKFDSRFNVNDRLPSDSSQMLNLSSGRFRGAKVTSSLIKDIVASAKEQGVDPWVLLSVVGRESTYGSGTKDNRERAGSKKDLVSGWTVAEDYRGYDPERFLADRQVPGVRTIKDYHRWRYEVDDEDAVQNYLAKNPKILEQYKKKLSSLPDVGDMDAFDLAARKIKKKGLRNYNPGDPTYEKMVYDDMKLLKSDKEMAAMMKSLGYKNGGEHGGLDRWFAEKWVDIKTGKECGRDEDEKRRGYPACRPSRRVNEDTPKTASELSSSERERFKRSKTSSERINYQHQRKEDGGETNETDMANKPNNPALWSRAKSMAKQKFDVYPSAYANGWAAKWYKSKGGTWSKAMYGMEVPMMEQGGKPEWLVEAQLKAQGYSGNALQQKMNSMAQGGEPSNEGFQALPEYVQEKIMSNMAFGGYLPEMFFGGKMKKNLQEAAPMLLKFAPMLFGAPPIMQKGGEPDGSMALGQINAAIDKLNTLRKFIQPESDLEPWVSSKLTLMDHYTDAVSDYMQYNPEAQGEMMEEPQGLPMPEMKNGGGIPERYKNMGFTKVGVKKESTRPGKKWMVLAQKGNQYKVVHGGYDGMKDFSQHGSEKRKENFWNRMGGKNSSKATDPFSPLYWHKRFGTWEDGGEILEMKGGGSTWSGNAWYQDGGLILPKEEDYLDYESYANAVDQYSRQVAEAEANRNFEEQQMRDAEAYYAPPKIKMPVELQAASASGKKTSRNKGSIVDYLASQGQPSDFASRAKLAASKGIKNYTGTAEQNTTLLQMLSGFTPKTTSKAPVENDEGVWTDQSDLPASVINIPRKKVNPQSVTPKQTAEEKKGFKERFFGARTADEYIAKDPYFFAEESDPAWVKLLDMPFTALRNQGARVALDADPFAMAALLLEGAASNRYGKKSNTVGEKTGKKYAEKKQEFDIRRAFSNPQVIQSSVPTPKNILVGPTPRQFSGPNVATYLSGVKKQKGGPVEGDVIDVTPEQLEMLKAQGYQFEIL